MQVRASSPGWPRLTDGRGGALRFTGIAVAENTAMAPLTGLQEQMRAAEAALAERLAGQAGDVVIVDGPLRPPSGLIVEYVKLMLRAVVLKRMFEDKEARGTAQPLVFTVLDELNRYAPRTGWAPIKEVLLDIAERGRSLGIILIGCQQTSSEVRAPDADPFRGF